MVTTSFRDDDEVLDLASELWSEEGIFKDKSDFYRFARDFTLSEAIGGYEPRYEGFEETAAELGEINGADVAVAHASDQFFRAFDYAMSVRNMLENENTGPEEKVDRVLERTYSFLQDEFGDTYVVQDLE